MLVGTCPYYMYDKGNLLFCEGVTMRYPDKKSKKDYFTCYCCSENNGYEKCTMHNLLCDYYNRLYNGEVIEPIAKECEEKKKRGRKPRLAGGL